MISTFNTDVNFYNTSDFCHCDAQWKTSKANLDDILMLMIIASIEILQSIKYGKIYTFDTSGRYKRCFHYCILIEQFTLFHLFWII